MSDMNVAELIEALERLAPKIESYSIDYDADHIVIPQTYEEYAKNGRKTAAVFPTCTITLRLKSDPAI